MTAADLDFVHDLLYHDDIVGPGYAIEEAGHVISLAQVFPLLDLCWGSKHSGSDFMDGKHPE